MMLMFRPAYKEDGLLLILFLKQKVQYVVQHRIVQVCNLKDIFFNIKTSKFQVSFEAQLLLSLSKNVKGS